ncbi:CGNR zinc finger domain-containing protein [Frankia sp. R82]|uniref:CGNR zinc finger domain-containing protein n=1 Tax=Frankia sp. R82 TaxID=2950553 RepID=UPI002043B8E7|nr:CGNR zinc finger domain-containing protein [Frankia sp. R82]MCM3882493.1 CGNR zinc finger domain-containing protein [Frankia sp. R82]
MDPMEAWSSHYGAPRALHVLGAFLNSVDERSFGAHRPHEELTEPAALGRWLVAHGLLPAAATETVTVTDAAFADALRLRAALRAAAAANQPGTQPAVETVELGEAADRLALWARPGPRGVDLEPADGSEITQALTRLVIAAALATADGTWQRVKMCAAPDCRVVFYDVSRPRTGRWCATAVCGNRTKTRRYRQRTASPS